MTDADAPPSTIPASVADADVPEERVETYSAIRHRQNRSNRFLKGPIPLSWIRQHIFCATDRLLLVLRAHADMRRSMEVKVGADVLSDAGIVDRKTAYRALNKLETSGTLTVSRRRGRRPVVCLLVMDGQRRSATTSV